MVFAFSNHRVLPFSSFVVLNCLLHRNHTWFGHRVWVEETWVFAIHACSENASSTGSWSFTIESNHFFLAPLYNIQISGIHLINITLTVMQRPVDRWLFYHVFVRLQLLNRLNRHASLWTRFRTFRFIFSWFFTFFIDSGCIIYLSSFSDCLDGAHLTLILSIKLLNTTFKVIGFGCWFFTTGEIELISRSIQIIKGLINTNRICRIIYIFHYKSIFNKNKFK